MPTEKKLTGYPSIDKPWLKHYTEETINTPLPECTVYEHVLKNNSNHLNDIAVEYFGNKISYGKLFQNIELVKNAFIAQGIKKGDKVIMFTSATPEMVYITLALCRIGAVANMINPLFTEDQIRDRINETDAQLLVALDQLYGKIKNVIPNTCIKKTIIIPVCNEMPTVIGMIAGLKMNKKFEYNATLVSWKMFLISGKGVFKTEDVKYEKDTPLIMVYSSGTTGASKGIVLTNDGINATISHYLSPDFPYNRGDRFLQMIPVWFSTGIVLSVLMPVCVGITSILEPVFSKENFAKDIKKYSPNMTLGTTSLWLYAANWEGLRNCDLSAMTFPITGGEQVLPRAEVAINTFLKSHGCKSVLLKGYGMCELGSTVSTDSSFVRKTGSTGYPIKDVIVSAFDIETNEEMQYGRRGEIRVQSPARMKEYYKNPDATEKYFYTDEQGNKWGCTGDLGYVDEEGFIYILGRASDKFTAQSGKEIYCFDIENVILENENIASCEVVGLSKDGYSVPVAHFVLEDTCQLSSEEIILQIHEKCKQKLDADCVPCGYKCRETFPVKSSGKRDMGALKEERDGFVLPADDKLVPVEL